MGNDTVRPEHLSLLHGSTYSLPTLSDRGYGDTVCYFPHRKTNYPNMKTKTLRRRVLELAAAGRTNEAIALIKSELTATRTVTSPTGSVIIDPDHRRQLAAVWVALDVLK
jgi:hypothetical protein